MATPPHRHPRLATVVSYCSRERAFVDALLRGAREFSDAVVLSVGDALYSGEPEDEAHIARVRSEHPDVTVVRYPVRASELSDPISLHNRAREVGVTAAREALGADAWVLLLDGDEVPDGPKFAAWWAVSRDAVRPDTAYKLLNYWAFLHPRLIAEPLEDSVLLVHASQLTPSALAHEYERDGILMDRGGVGALVVQRRIGDMRGQPMFWHYSWVRGSRAALHAKVNSWGHRHDRTDWNRLVDDAYDVLDRGEWPTRDFVHGYALRVLPEGAPAPNVRFGEEDHGQGGDAE